MVSVHPVARPLWPPQKVPQNEDDGDLTLQEFEKLFPTQRHAKRKRGEPAKLMEYLWWSSKKKMKKAGVLYASVHEDRVEMPLRYPIAWATLRHLQCRELTRGSDKRRSPFLRPTTRGRSKNRGTFSPNLGPATTCKNALDIA